MTMACDHSGTHSGATRYLREAAQLRLVVVCDECGSECDELTRVDYLPQPELPELPGQAREARKLSPA
jgi:hypothetical protein